MRRPWRDVNTPVLFWQRVKVGHPNECWPWQRGKSWHGYGRMSYQGKDRPAHRLAYLFHYGSIPDNCEICHRCDNPPCCNPLHLFAGSHAENMADSRIKGRAKPPPGIRAKLNQVAANDIRRRWENGESQLGIAALYKVDSATVNGIIRGRCWKSGFTGITRQQAKLSLSIAREIRNRSGSNAALAAEYGVSPKTIRLIRACKIWKEEVHGRRLQAV